CWEGWVISLRQKQKKLIMLPSETMIWQPEFTDKTLSRKTGAVQWINAYYNVYRPHTNNGGLSPCRMKKNGNRLFRCPDFMIHYTFLTNATA
ncbi:hypothetical protein ACSWEM_005524, partial [Escherichia coli]